MLSPRYAGRSSIRYVVTLDDASLFRCFHYASYYYYATIFSMPPFTRERRIKDMPLTDMRRAMRCHAMLRRYATMII